MSKDQAACTATPCEEAIERLKLFVERRPSYPDDAVMMHMDAHDMLRMSHLRALAAFFTRSAKAPRHCDSDIESAFTSLVPPSEAMELARWAIGHDHPERSITRGGIKLMAQTIISSATAAIDKKSAMEGVSIYLSTIEQEPNASVGRRVAMTMNEIDRLNAADSTIKEKP